MARIYRRTEAGERVLHSSLITLSPELYRVLYALDGDAHVDTIRGRTRDLPDFTLTEALAHLEQFGFVRSQEAGAESDLDFTQHFRMPSAAAQAAPAAPERERLASASQSASGALAKRGVFVAESRIRNRPAARGLPQDHVVLVVEDDESQAALTRRICEWQGFRVHLAASRAAMSRAFQAGLRPSIVLLDAMLPDGDGFEILARVRAHPMLALVPVVMLTARSDQRDVLKGLQLGADAYVVKPFERGALSTVLASVLPFRRDKADRAAAEPVRSVPSSPPAAAAAPEPLPARALQQAGTVQAALRQRGVYLATRRLKSRNPLPGRGQEISILLVEDDSDLAALVRRHLEKGGYAVRHVGDVAHLTRELKRARPTLVLLDATLPDGDGFNVLDRIRKHPAISELPIIMLTARSSAREIAQGLALGADGYITKPYTREVLLDSVARVLKLGGF